MSPFSVVIALLLLCSLALPIHSFDPSKPYPHLVADTFINIKNSPLERLVLFYYSSTPSSTTALSILNTAARRLRGRFPHFAFQHCDGDLQANKAEFAMKYTGPVTVADLVDHVRHKYLPSSPADVLNFTTADEFYDLLDSSPTPSPIFVKFYEPWCEHCKRLAPTFAASASFLRNSSVRFMEVQCSANGDTKAWCQRHDVQSYPQLILFTGETKVKFEEEMRSVAAFDRFFTSKVSGYSSVVQEDRKKASRKRKNASTQDSTDSSAAQEREEGVVKPAATVKGVEVQVVSQEAARVPVEVKSQAKVGRTVSPQMPAGGAVQASQWTVEQRLGALEGEVREMHDTVKEIKKAIDALRQSR